MRPKDIIQEGAEDNTEGTEEENDGNNVENATQSNQKDGKLTCVCQLPGPSIHPLPPVHITSSSCAKAEGGGKKGEGHAGGRGGQQGLTRRTTRELD